MKIGMKEQDEKITLEINHRILCEYATDSKKFVIFMCGIHGNEPMSVLALQEVSKSIKSQNIQLKGAVIGLIGNIAALGIAERYIECDLNRIWTEKTMNFISNGSVLKNEKAEMKAIWSVLEPIMKDRMKEDIVVYDLHTTSSPSVPFITINDTISNRDISKKYPLATVFGIEEYLNGPLLSYMNEIGVSAIGFEGGQHLDKNSLENHKAFIWLTLANQGFISMDMEEVKEAFIRLQSLSVDPHKFFEITYRKEVLENDYFKMYKGYTNFQSIEKGMKLAINNGIEIVSEWSDRIFMPLYQDKGDDGFFIIRRIPRFYLWLSRMLRKFNFEKLVLLLPGVSTYNNKKHILAVNNRVARVLRNELFHLLGFRQKIHFTDSITLYIRRERQ
jgi:predicted deacylase